jgi:hypothetical protein
MKYIDAELLLKEIEKYYDEYRLKFNTEGDPYYLGLADGLDMAQRVIDSLQQEQPCERVDVEKYIDEMYEKQGYGIMLNTSEHLTIEEEAKLYSFNIESKIFNSLPQELQGEWRKEIESAYIIGASAFRVSSEDLEAEMGKYFDGWYDDPEYGQAVLPHTYECIGVSDCKDIARHFYELGCKAKKEE